MSVRLKTLPVIAIGMLSACGGGSTSETPFVALSAVTVEDGTTLQTFFDEVGANTVSSHRPVEGFGSFGYDDRGLHFIGTTNDQTARADVFAVIDEQNNTLIPGARYIRARSEMPVSGRARYRGNYAGIITRTPGGDHEYFAESYVDGNVRLDVEFQDDSIEGAITDRNRYLTKNGAEAAYAMQDVTLFETTIDAQGQFRGTTGGGKFDNFAFIPSTGGDLTGTYEGAVSGELVERGTGGATTSAVGIVRVDHYYDTTDFLEDDYQEYGAFVTELTNEG